MTTFDINSWKPSLSRLNSIILRTERWRHVLTPEALSTGWCGLPPATESEIVKTEKQLGITLPPSYRSFLSISDGWKPFSSFVGRLLSVKEIDRYRDAEPEDLAILQSCYQEDDVPDENYLDYETPENMVSLRHRYYPDCLLIGKKWDGGGGELVLINPLIVSPDGEWEAIFFANWIPGNYRYRSFFDFVNESINDLERIEGSAI
jgi:hypothetical protein